ncbi:hypothetical protein AU255_18415 [Methyloprofundus sedimenti]|uniref:Uncharacterized protein n=2 Tax=Methyloprofundus sedimenti TaxID=1420851 RepID=A0A1V8M1Y9_9GAMM|nr:hypothetical protein AU255_18415 [Methyloprofundus sedimenti]
MMNKITFHRKPMPILADYRPLYKITQVLLILFLCSRGKKSSLIRIHLISWAIKDSRRKSILLESAKKNKVHFGVWGIDPAVNFALQYSLGEKLVEMSGVSYKLTDKGVNYIKKIGEDDILEGEYSFLKSIGCRITEGMVQSIVEEWE